MNNLPERIDKIKQLRDQGLTYLEIGKRMGFSATTIRANEQGLTSLNNRSIKGNPKCNRRMGDTSIICQRQAGHAGIHLSDTTGKLIYWEMK